MNQFAMYALTKEAGKPEAKALASCVFNDLNLEPGAGPISGTVYSKPQGTVPPSPLWP